MRKHLEIPGFESWGHKKMNGGMHWDDRIEAAYMPPNPNARFRPTTEGRVGITCTSDWQGCTETGFGESVEVIISMENARALRDFLTEALDTPPDID